VITKTDKQTTGKANCSDWITDIGCTQVATSADVNSAGQFHFRITSCYSEQSVNTCSEQWCWVTRDRFLYHQQYLRPIYLLITTIRYDTKEEFNLDSKGCWV